MRSPFPASFMPLAAILRNLKSHFTFAVAGSEMASRSMTDLKMTLSAKGYPGTHIILLSEGGPLEKSCSRDGTVEIRISRKGDPDAVAVVVAGEN